jgi:hypothetical protein
VILLIACLGVLKKIEGEGIIFPILGSCVDGYRISQNQYIRDCNRDYDPIKSRIARAVGLPFWIPIKNDSFCVPSSDDHKRCPAQILLLYPNL